MNTKGYISITTDEGIYWAKPQYGWVEWVGKPHAATFLEEAFNLVATSHEQRKGLIEFHPEE